MLLRLADAEGAALQLVAGDPVVPYKPAGVRPDKSDLPPELRNLDPHDPQDCPPTARCRLKRRIACGSA
jgi:hypothetical protein